MVEAPSLVLLLNGVGSAGKSSVARELQEVVREPLLHVPMDSFLEMLPAKSFETPEGLSFQKKLVDGAQVVEIVTGPLAARTFHGMRRAMGALADMGLNLVVDDVADVRDVEDYRQVFARHHLSVVGVFASLPVLESRERERGDRMIGLARAQYNVVHEGIDYDLVIETDRRTPGDCAAEIAQELGLATAAAEDASDQGGKSTA